VSSASCLHRPSSSALQQVAPEHAGEASQSQSGSEDRVVWSASDCQIQHRVSQETWHSWPIQFLDLDPKISWWWRCSSEAACKFSATPLCWACVPQAEKQEEVGISGFQSLSNTVYTYTLENKVERSHIYTVYTYTLSYQAGMVPVCQCISPSPPLGEHPTSRSCLVWASGSGGRTPPIRPCALLPIMHVVPSPHQNGKVFLWNRALRTMMISEIYIYIY